MSGTTGRTGWTTGRRASRVGDMLFSVEDSLTQKPGGTTRHHGMRGDIFRDDGSGPNEGTGANGNSGQDDRAAANGGAAAHAGGEAGPVGFRLQLAVGGGAGVEVVDEHHPVTDEHF